ncbi:MAG: hypothetical protein IT372_01615 [Polyangiaceae bacterium]|nr:hypothetical protein [Polyangiaceae bacterium]
MSPVNARELVEQWTNVHGIDATADATSTVSGATRSEHRGASGEALVEAYSIPGMGHGTAVDPGYAPAGGCGATGAYMLDANICSTYQAGLFFGLDDEAGGGSGGSGGSGGEGGSGGSGGSGGEGSACEQLYDANYYHVVQGRAVRCGLGGSYVCAVGSGQQLGLYTMVYTWVRRTAPSYYEAGQCQ